MRLSKPPQGWVYGNGERFEPPLYFMPKETKVGYLAFMLDTLEGVKKCGIPVIHIKDGNGTDYKFRTDPKSLLQMQEAARTVDYPPPS